MSSPINIADRITAGLSVDAPIALIRIAAEATTQGINEASATLLQEWAADVLAAANELPGMAGQYWASIAAELRSLAWERTTGVRP
jgi:hypothetical protein